MEFNFGIGTTIQDIFCNFVEKEWWYMYNNSHMAAQVRECKHLLRKSIQVWKYESRNYGFVLGCKREVCDVM